MTNRLHMGQKQRKQRNHTMDANIHLHGIVKTEVKDEETANVKWTRYIFTDKEGKALEVVVYKK